jgi:YfiH family protein
VPEADAIVVRAPHRPAAVLVADCVPIALSGPGVAAAVHAGWRGLCAGVIEAAVATAGAARGFSAWIGPCIGPCCYEVGAEVPEQFARGHRSAPDCCERVGGALHFDLRRAAAAVLEACGVAVAGDLDVPCTCCDPRFFSHRRDGTLDRQALLTWVEATR